MSKAFLTFSKYSSTVILSVIGIAFDEQLMYATLGSLAIVTGVSLSYCFIAMLMVVLFCKDK